MKHILGLSGGKDSSCLALAMRERHPEIAMEYVCTPTGNELPELFLHLEGLECLLGQPIKRLYEKSLLDLCRDMQMLPNFRARWCTRILKIEPTIAYVASLPPGSVLYVGLRADEEERRGIFGEDIAIRFPLREWGWGLKDVWSYLQKREVKIPRRTDCGLCFYQRIGEWWNLWHDHPERFAEGIAIEKELGHTFRTPGKDTWPTTLEDMGAAFKGGRIPTGAAVNAELFDDYQECRVCSL